MSVASLRAHLKNLQIVFPDWMSFADASGALSVKVDRKIADQLRAAGVKVLPRVANIDANGEWFENRLGEFLRDPDAANAFRDRLLATLAENKADGVNIDIENLHPQEERVYVDWLDRLSNALHAHGFLVTVDVPMNDEAYDYEAIGRIADAVVLMAYDEHWSTSSPGPIASRPWYEDGLDQAAERIDPDKLIAGVGAYAYDWTAGRRRRRSAGVRRSAGARRQPQRAHRGRRRGRQQSLPLCRRCAPQSRRVDARRVLGLERVRLRAPRRRARRGAVAHRSRGPTAMVVFRRAQRGQFRSARAVAHAEHRHGADRGQGELLRVDEGRRDGVRTSA